MKINKLRVIQNYEKLNDELIKKWILNVTCNRQSECFYKKI